MDDPRYVVVAMLDAPKATADTFGYTTAGWVSAPIVSKVVARTGALLGVIPDDRRDVDIRELLPLIGKTGE
jgi:cell division protein FtsI (penicillin-binding protein 3)